MTGPFVMIKNMVYHSMSVKMYSANSAPPFQNLFPSATRHDYSKQMLVIMTELNLVQWDAQIAHCTEFYSTVTIIVLWRVHRTLVHQPIIEIQE